MKDILVFFGIIVSLVVIVFFTWNATAYRDVDMLKKEAPAFLSKRGFVIASYDGFEGSPTHGGFTWYQVRDSSDYLYNLCVGEWRGELMIYNQTCLNAVKNSK